MSAKPTRKSFSIRSLFLLTLIAALLVIGGMKFLPHVNDSGFIRKCFANKGKSFREFEATAKAMNRSVEETYNHAGNLIGVSARSKDGRIVYLLMSDADQTAMLNKGIDDWKKLPIAAIESYRIVEENSAGLILGPTKQNP